MTQLNTAIYTVTVTANTNDWTCVFIVFHDFTRLVRRKHHSCCLFGWLLMEGVTINTLAILPYYKVNIRAGNEPSRSLKFRNLGEGPYLGFLLVESVNPQ